MPPVLSDTFGTRRVGLIFPKIFAVLNLSNLFANYATGWLRDRALGAGCGALAARVESDAAFEAAFGAPRDALPALVAAKTVTIPQLMRLVPDGTPDPSPFMHNEMLCARDARARSSRTKPLRPSLLAGTRSRARPRSRSACTWARSRSGRTGRRRRRARSGPAPTSARARGVRYET